jgi:hypothetical protein
MRLLAGDAADLGDAIVVARESFQQHARLLIALWILEFSSNIRFAPEAVDQVHRDG